MRARLIGAELPASQMGDTAAGEPQLINSVYLDNQERAQNRGRLNNKNRTKLCNESTNSGEPP